ncbi:MAG: hypothetical protein U0T82_14720 [Bacteroidales bacterium]
MALSKHAARLKKMIDQAIEDHRLTRKEYEDIIHLAHEDGAVDHQEEALLRELQQMISDKTIKIVP